jgi:hypothetical protein
LAYNEFGGVSEQDAGLETLSKVISRQRAIAETIGGEVDLQNGKFPKK